jgi:hypothetical protein
VASAFGLLGALLGSGLAALVGVVFGTAIAALVWSKVKAHELSIPPRQVDRA